MPEPCQHPGAVAVAVVSEQHPFGYRDTRVTLICTHCGMKYAETRDDPDGRIMARALDALNRREILRPVRLIDG